MKYRISRVTCPDGDFYYIIEEYGYPTWHQARSFPNKYYSIDDAKWAFEKHQEGIEYESRKIIEPVQELS